MNKVQEYLQHYVKESASEEGVNWDKLPEDFKQLIRNTNETMQGNIQLPSNQVVDFHDATIEGNIKPNVSNDTFDLTIRVLRSEQLEDSRYVEIDPIYVKFNFDNKHRSDLQKLAVKSSSILSLVSDEQNLGVVYLNKDWKVKTLYVEGADLSNSQVVEKVPTRKPRF